MSKLLKKAIALILVLILVSANLVILGEYTIALALSDEELNEQTSETNHDNVEFNAYFEGETHIATFDVGDSDAKLYVQIKVNNAGYLENGIIELQNTNFKISEDVTNSNIQSIDRENNRILLNRITNGTTVTFELPIEILEKESISEDYFNKETLTKFTGAYMDGQGREREITKEVTNKISWKNTAEVEATVEATKFIPYATNGNYGVILQTKINSKVKDNILPIKNTNIEITVPTINNVKPTSVTVLATYTAATNGKDNGLDFTNSNYSYDAEAGKLSIKTTNNVEEVSWKKNASDEYLVNYIFEGQEIYNYANANGIDSTITVIPNISVYNGEETLLTTTLTTPIQYEEQAGAITDFKVELPDDISKGYIYSNFDTDAKVETEYYSKYTATINAANLVTTVEFIQAYDKFLTEEASEGSTNVSDTNYAYNKRVEISQELFNKMLGEDGVITIKDISGTELGQINKDTQLTDGMYVLDISSENSNSLDIITTAPITDGQIEINIIKALKGNIGYSKDQMKDFVKLSASLQGKTNTTTFEASTQTLLKEPETKVELEINRTDLTTVLENENVEIRAILNTSSVYNALFKNPTLKITFPANVEKVTLNSTNLVLDNGLKVKSATVGEESGRQVINVELEGTQTEYAIDAEYKGAIIILNTDITVSTLTPSGTAKITMRYTNENDVATKATGTIEQTINYVAPSGITTATGISNYKAGEPDILSISDEPKTVEIDTYSDARTATMSGTIINNYPNDINSIVILGRIPAQENKVIDSDKDMGSNFTIPLSSGLVISGIEATNYKIYYSDNQNASKDLSDSSNGWSETSTTTSKSYMVVFNTDYKLAAGGRIAFSYDLAIPENLSTNNSAFGMYKVYYTNNSEIGAVGESKASAIIGLTTGKGPELEAELQSTADVVREGQIVKMKVTVNNIGETVAENVRVNVPVPEFATFVEYTISNGFYELSDETMSIDIGDIDVGESALASYYIKFDEYIPTITIVEVEGNEGEEIQIDDIINANRFPKTITNKAFVATDGITGEIPSNECVINLLDGKIAINLVSDIPEDATLHNGQTMEYIINLKNISAEGDLANTVVTMALPEGIKFNNGIIKDKWSDEEETSEGITYNQESNTVQINVGTLSITKFIKLQLEVLQFDGQISMIATARADGTEEHYSNISEYAAKPIKLEISELTSTPRYVKEGEIITYNIKISNVGASIISGIKISGVLPSELDFEKATYMYAGEEQAVSNLKGDRIEIAINQLAIGESIDIKVMAKAKALPDENDKEVSMKFSVTANNFEAVETNTVTNIIEYNPEIHNPGGETTDPIINRYKITGTAWIDENRDGTRGAEEQTLSNIQVILLNKDANSIVRDLDTNEEKITTTSSNGTYQFDNLPNGEYLVVFIYDSSNYSLTTYQADGVDEAFNSDVIDINLTFNGERRIAGITDILTIDGDNVRDIDIGLYAANKFDLRLDKYINKITLTTPTIGTSVQEHDNLSVARVEVLGRNVGQSSAVIEYNIVVTNEGSVPGYVKKIVDYLPKEVSFSTELNTDWYLSNNGNIYNASLENEVINPGESKAVNLIVSIQITEDILGTIGNSAEIYEYYNEQGLQDIDSVAGNGANAEDDMSTADLVVGIVTGRIITYTSIALVVIALLGFGIFEIKKHVLNKKV